MSDNVLQTLQKLVQDVIAPDVRETKVRVESNAKETATRFDSVSKQIESLAKETSTRFGSVSTQIESLAKETSTRFGSASTQIESLAKDMDNRFESMQKQMSFMEKSILSAIAASLAQKELASAGEIASLRERVAVLESQRNQVA